MPNKLLFGSDIDFVIATLAYSSAKGSYVPKVLHYFGVK